MSLSAKRATKRLIADEASKRTGRPMTNKAAKKWLRRQPHAPKVDRGFVWPRVASLPTLYRGLARMARYPRVDAIPFGWKRLTQPGVTESIDMPLWLWWGICAKQWIRTAPARGFLWMIGVRRVSA